jgi:AcrR family transcriptional regulator
MRLPSASYVYNMRMASGMSISRRIPQQQRGARRVAQLLEAAAAEFAQVGYDAATMTAIAERAGASIGAVYQYFPNKESIVLALRTEYGNEMEAHWTAVEEFTAGMSVAQIAHRLVDIMVEFLEEHPAFFAVLDAPVKYTRDQQARQRLRLRIANVFRSRNPALSPETAYRMANISLQIVKGMNVLYAEAGRSTANRRAEHEVRQERQALVDEYKQVLTTYLASRLTP